MINGELKVHVETVPYSGAANIYIYTVNPMGGKRSFAKPVDLVFEEREDNDARIEPTLTMRTGDTDQLLASLAAAIVRAGYRVDTNREAGELSAMKNHLEDMRKLVFQETVILNKLER